MSYATILEISDNQTLLRRIQACAAQEGIPDPSMWVETHKWELACTPGWGDDWSYAKDTATVNQNPDIGARDDVISDSKILAAVQALNA